MGFGEFRDQVEAKARRTGAVVLIADRWFPSSKLCSCGRKYAELKLEDRIWTCPHCGVTHDRDLNAAKNLDFYYEFVNTVSSTGIYAWGEETLEAWRQLVLARASSQEADIKAGGQV